MCPSTLLSWYWGGAAGYGACAVEFRQPGGEAVGLVEQFEKARGFGGGHGLLDFGPHALGSRGGQPAGPGHGAHLLDKLGAGRKFRQLGSEARRPEHAHRVVGHGRFGGRAQDFSLEVGEGLGMGVDEPGPVRAVAQGHGVNGEVAQGQVCLEIAAARPSVFAAVNNEHRKRLSYLTSLGIARQEVGGGCVNHQIVAVALRPAEQQVAKRASNQVNMHV